MRKTPRNAMKTISLKLPEPLLANLDARACAAGTSRSELIRAALSEHLGRRSRFPKGSVADLGRDLWGSLTGGPKDLSTNPKHLRGFAR